MRKSNTKLIESRQQQLIFLLGMFSVLLALYFIFLGRVFTLSVGRQEAIRSVSELEPNIATLEFKYLGLVAAVDPEMAKSKGFVPVGEQVIFASINRDNLALKLENDGL